MLGKDGNSGDVISRNKEEKTALNHYEIKCLLLEITKSIKQASIETLH